MKSKYAFFFIFLLTQGWGIAQSSFHLIELQNVRTKHSFKPFQVSNSRSSNIPGDLKDYSIFTIDARQVREISEVRDKAFTISLPLPNGRKIPVILKRVELFSDSLICLPSQKKVAGSSVKHYRGVISGIPNSIAAFSFFDTEVAAMISHPTSGNFVVGKIDQEENHIIYNDENIRHERSTSCDTPEDYTPYTVDELKENINHRYASSNCVELYIEVDHDIFKKRGNLENTEHFIEGILNQVAALYAAEDINITVAPLHVWTEPSPYNAATPAGLLQQFKLVRKNWQGDLAGLLSFKSKGGIAAGFNGLCNSNRANSMSFSSISNSYSTIPTYSWSVDVVTHELGHLMGSRHTHACVWNGNSTAIDGCAGYTEGGCSVPSISSDSGTIMSYCHNAPGGKNFALGFGEQPGNVIRNRVKNAQCLSICEGTAKDTCLFNKIEISIFTDRYGNETSWTLRDSTHNIINSGSQYERLTMYNIEECLPAECYTFSVYDSHGDGMCCKYGDGYFQLTSRNAVIARGGEFKDSTHIEFCLDENYNHIDTIAPEKVLISVDDISFNSSMISWNHSPEDKDLVYQVFLNETNIGNTQDSFYLIYSLEPSTEYEVYVIAQDQSANLSSPSNIVHFETLSQPLPDYCELSAKVSTYEWIDGIKINHQSINPEQLESNELIYHNTSISDNQITIDLKAGFNGSAYNEHWYLWIDINRDGQLTHDELLLEEVSIDDDYNNYSIELPEHMPSGLILMRIAMKYNENADPCGSFSFGDTQDIVLNISYSTEQSLPSKPQTTKDIKLYPSLITQGFTNIEFPNSDTYTYAILNTSGRMVQNGHLSEKNSRLNLNNISSGIYFICITHLNNTISKKFIVP